MEGEEPRRWWHVALAMLLSTTLLGTTYALFDPDLGTPVPLFQEFTCRGKLEVIATDAQDKPQLRAPEMALKMRALGDSEPRPAYFTTMMRIRGEAWEVHFSVAIESGEHLMHVFPIGNETEVYVEAKDLQGRFCAGRSATLSLPRS